MSSLPGDSGPPRTPRQVFGAAYALASATPVAAPRLVAWSEEVGALLGLERPAQDTGGLVDVLAGNEVAPGSRPYASCYGGHQFGVWAGQLGDGRVIALGELEHARRVHEVQLKGAGPTAFSRRADGRAVLRSSIREYLCSEAMHHLGIPTTRALALVTTGEGVVRDMFYDGRPRMEPGAIVTRVAPTFVRFGHFELAAQRDDRALLERLVDWVVTHHYPELVTPDVMATRGAFFVEVCRRTAVMIAHWMAQGFVHGVMNTDNFSILGVTIDYGPYGWLDSYDASFTPNTTDFAGRRYAYGRQPSVAIWNLARLAGALLPLIGSDAADDGLDVYEDTAEATYGMLMAKKLGLVGRVGADDDGLHTALLELFEAVETDWTIFFRRLADVDVAEGASDDRRLAAIGDAFYAPDGVAGLTGDQRARVAAWLARYAELVRSQGQDPVARRASMHAVSPWFILRNYLAQDAIERAEAGDMAGVRRLERALERPYIEDTTQPELAARRPDWARNRAGCSALSCSS